MAVPIDPNRINDPAYVATYKQLHGDEEYLYALIEAGVTTSDEFTNWISNNKDTAAVEQYARETYGYLGWYLDDPEIGPILTQAAQEEWSPERLQGQLVTTNWWKETSQTARQWDYLRNNDPATAQQQVEGRVAQLRQQAERIGFTVSSGALAQMAEDSLRLGWNEAQANEALVAYATVENMVEGSTLAGYVSNVQEMAADYMVTISDDTAFEYAQRIAEGTASIDGIKAIFKERALVKYPHLANQIEAGQLQSFFADYQQLIGSYLGVHPSTIDLENDPKWSVVIGGPDRAPLSQTEVIHMARATDQFRRTERGRAEEADFSRTILEGMGVASF